MLKGDWIKHPAFGVALFALLTLGPIALGKKYQIVTRADYKAATQELRNRPEIRFPVATPERETEPSRREWREEKNLEAQRKMARWTVVMAVFTGIGILLLYRTLNATHETVDQMKDANSAAWKAVEINADLGERQIKIAERAADEQRETMQTAHAAFLVQTDVWAETWLPDSEKLRISYRNIGQSPAYNIRISARTYPLYAGDFFGSQVISSLMTFNDFLPQHENGSFQLGFERDKIFQGSSRAVDLRVYGVILWDDVFGTSRGIRFNYASNVPKIGPINKFYNDWFGNHILSKWHLQKIDGLGAGQNFDLDSDEDDEM